MNPKRAALLIAMMYAGAAMETGLFHESKTVADHKKPDKCFRPECNQVRSGDKLYCSSACCKLDKQRLKEKNKSKL